MTTPALTQRIRIDSIDVLRGLIMIIMALDHTRDYFHVDAFISDPTDLTKTNTILFFTRWITHFCMPCFVLLSGVSIRISSFSKSKKELSNFLFTRGLWMVLLEFTVMRFGYFFNFYYDVTILSVLWLFGMCMIMMAGLVYLSVPAVLGLSAGIIVLHDLAGLVTVDGASPFFAPWVIFLRAGFIGITPNFALVTSYPLIPWLAVMMLGYYFGGLYSKNTEAVERQRILLRTGIAFLVGFVILRLVNVYGDIPWKSQTSSWFTVLSFINTSKYPVSLLFTLMTLGPLLILLALLERTKGLVTGWLREIGRVPLFYFILHFYLIHAAALVLTLIRTGKSLSDLDFHFAKSFGGIEPGNGISLPWVYVAWLLVVACMYPLCKWYNQYKSTHTHRWLSYL